MNIMEVPSKENAQGKKKLNQEKTEEEAASQPTVAPGIEDDVLEEEANQEERELGEYTEVLKLEVEPRRQ